MGNKPAIGRSPYGRSVCTLRASSLRTILSAHHHPPRHPHPSQELGWQWDEPEAEQEVYEYLKEIQLSGEEIYLEVCVPEPDLPGYPYIDRHPDDYPIVLTDEMIVLMGDLDEDERPEEPIYEPFEEAEYV